MVLEHFVFEEPDGPSGNALVAAAVLEALVQELCREIVMVFLRQYVIFVFVSPDDSLFRHHSVLQGRRMRAIYRRTAFVGRFRKDGRGHAVNLVIGQREIAALHQERDASCMIFLLTKRVCCSNRTPDS